MTTRAISLPLSCFIYRLSEPKPIEKWSTFIKINEESFSNLKKRFVIDGYGSFQDKARVRDRKTKFFIWRQAQEARTTGFSEWQAFYSQLRIKHNRTSTSIFYLGSDNVSAYKTRDDKNF